MKALKNNQHGLSLVEVTIMLLVLMLLTGVLAPSIMDFVHDAQWVKVKEDCEAIGLSVARLTRDVGPCLKFKGDHGCTKYNRVDLLHSDGPVVDWDSLANTAGEVWSDNLYSGQFNWNTEPRSDSMETQLVTNITSHPYPTPISNYPGDVYPVGPQYNLGWRGAYLSPPIGADPWNHRYLVNTAFLSAATDAFHHGEGHKTKGWSKSVFCLSAGPNGIYETPIGGSGYGGVLRKGDDFTYVISGGTR